MKGFFFDMDGVLFNSMPKHAVAWETVMQRHGLQFTQHDCFLQEGRTGHDVISDALNRLNPDKSVSDEEVEAIYQEKAQLFVDLGAAPPIDGVLQVLQTIKSQPDTQIWIVTGSAQRTLFKRLDSEFPGIFSPDRMVTAFDVKHGKPNPEPYLIAWERSGLKKEECCVIENAPLGCRAAKAADIYTIIVNTGPLRFSDFEAEQPDLFLPDMHALHAHLPQLLA